MIWHRPVVLCAVLATVLKLVIAFSTAGTNDATTWEKNLSKVRSDGWECLYRKGIQITSQDGAVRTTQQFIHPPAIVTALKLFGASQDITGLPLRFWLRAACAFADLGVALLLCEIVGPLSNVHLLMLAALCPISILISGFHANTDPIMIFFVVLCVFFIERKNHGMAGFAFGLAACVKIVPALFAPTILLYLRGTRPRIVWGGTAAAVWLGFSLPYIAQQPKLIFGTIAGYSGSVGLWGFYLLSMLVKGTGRFAQVEKWIALFAVIVTPVVFRYLKRRPALYLQCGLIAFLFLFLSPGFGLQYLAWTVPWIAALSLRYAVTYSIVSGLSMLAIYAQGIKASGVFGYSDLIDPKTRVVKILFGLILWATIGLMAMSLLRRTGTQNEVEFSE